MKDRVQLMQEVNSKQQNSPQKAKKPPELSISKVKSQTISKLAVIPEFESSETAPRLMQTMRQGPPNSKREKQAQENSLRMLRRTMSLK